MILLFNVKITQHGLSHYDRAPWLPKYNRVDIFKYCLASYTAIKPVISKSLFYIELAPEFEHCKEELEAYIYRLFPDCILHWYRNFYTRDWRTNWDEIAEGGDDLIWFNGNDDHIFMDYGLDVLENGLNLLRNDPDPMSVIFYSHWAAQCRMSNYYNAELVADGDYVKFQWRTYDAIRIIKTERFKHYWFSNDFGDLPVYRTDALYHVGHNIISTVYSPTRELVRHYDGDSHLTNGLNSPFDIANITPPLVIPPGFFEGKIKIRIGYNNRLEGWVNINPASHWLYAANQTGADYRWTIEDIPLFWLDKINVIDVASDYDTELMYQFRDAAILATTRIPMNCYQIKFDATPGSTPPEIWYKKHLRYDKN